MDYSKLLKFKYTWRNYQARVLENTKNYLKDGKVHIVAAPGSGKTTLGIELIFRMGEVALVFAPSITIREQWVSRILDDFWQEGLNPEEYLSQDLKNPKAITVVTYQALHSAMTKYKGSLDESGKEEDNDSDDVVLASNVEEVDYSDFDLIKTMQENKLGLICLDECHHLRSEWWKALEEFKKEFGNLKVIALTATPPYDSNATMWNRYMNMCGEIDEEIAVPELVKEGSLCPHQDFVYFNYPTKEEKAEVAKFKSRSNKVFEKLMSDVEFAEAIKSYKGLKGAMSDDELLENPNYFAAVLIFAQSKSILFPDRFKKLLGTKMLPMMSPDWMEILLQGFLYGDVKNYTCDEAYRKELISYLKAEGLIEKKIVSFTTTPSLEKLLTTSKGKCESIKDIVSHEYGNMGSELRMLILTDYIRKEYEKSVGTDEDVTALGVLPFFEQLRRSVGAQTNMRLGVLCGTVVVIPVEAKDALLEAIGESGRVSFSSVGNLPESDYVKVNPVGDAHFLTGAVTSVFTKGYMQVLIGTKSLLGEGWDSPCINSLILASFVGSFMLSNQMRGRAIRVFKQNPEKTSNIWHLVCLAPWKEAQKDKTGKISDDYATLERRMDHFLGLHYTENLIENGIVRLSIIQPPFNEKNVEEINKKMLALSDERASLKVRWASALSFPRQMDIVEETEVVKESMPKTVFGQVCTELLLAVIAFIYVSLIQIETLTNGGEPSMLALFILAVIAVYALTKVPLAIQLMDTEKRLYTFGNAIRKGLLKMNLLEGARCSVEVEREESGDLVIYLSGGTGRDKALFTKCVNELFGVVDNQRYILVRNGRLKDSSDFFVVPEVFGKRKEDAELFYECVKSYVGKYQLIYTRSEAGRPLLLEARIKAMANKEKPKTRKRVKSF